MSEPSTGRQLSRWQTFLERLMTIDDAMNTGYDELQDRRIARLEAAVDKLNMRLAPDGGPLPK